MNRRLALETRTITVDSTDSHAEAVKEAVALLEAGEVVALPTETVYGLAADATNPDAVAKIFEAKERPSFDPLIVHLPDKAALDDVAAVPDELKKLVAKLTHHFWPGPLTVVLPKTDVVPDIVTSGLPTVAVRQSADPIFKSIITEFEKPIAAPSANRFGSISPTSASAVARELDGRIPLIIDGGACAEGIESTIVKPSGAEPKPELQILRPGPVTPEDLKRYAKIVVAASTTGEDSSPNPEVPGQLASHYAPSTPLYLLDSPDDFKPDENKTYALLSYRGRAKDGYLDLADFKQVATLSPGSGKLPEAAVRLFFLLRQLDESGADIIIAEPVPGKGLGLAIMDRLRRASAKR